MYEPYSEDSYGSDFQKKEKTHRKYLQQYWFSIAPDQEDFLGAIANKDSPQLPTKVSLNGSNTTIEPNPPAPESSAFEAEPESTTKKYMAINFDEEIRHGYGLVFRDQVHAFRSKRHSKRILKLSRARHLSDRKIQKMKEFYLNESRKDGIGLNKYYELLIAETTSNVKNTYKAIFRDFSKWYLENECIQSLLHNKEIKVNHIVLGRFVEFVKNIKYARIGEDAELIVESEIESDSDDQAEPDDRQ